MARLIGVSIAIAFMLSGIASADDDVQPQGLGAGTVATATPTGLVGGTVATATPTTVPTATVIPTETPVPATPTFFALINEDGCAVAAGRHSHLSWWMIAVPIGIVLVRRRRLFARMHAPVRRLPRRFDE